MENEELEIKKEEEKKSSRFKRINMELVFFLILGFLLGIAIKTEAAKRVTIGFDDYKISSLKQGYDFDQLQQNLEQQQSASSSANSPDSSASGDNTSGSGNGQSDNTVQGN